MISVPQTEPPAEDEEMIIAPLCSIFRRFLKLQGLKFTSERAVILDAVLAKKGLFEAEQLLFEMRQENHRVSKATIYRTLKHLVEAGIIREVFLDAKQAHYQMAYGRRPTEHLINMQTNEIIEFYAPELIELRKKICQQYGLDPVSHRLIVYGIPKKTSESK